MTTGLTTSATITIRAPATEVWRAITTPELIKAWFSGVDTDRLAKSAAHWSIAASLGGRSYEDKGMIVRFEPPRLLVHTHGSQTSGKPAARALAGSALDAGRAP